MLLLMAEAAVVPAVAAAVAKGHSSAVRTSSGRTSARSFALVDRRMFAINPLTACPECSKLKDALRLEFGMISVLFQRRSSTRPGKLTL